MILKVIELFAGVGAQRKGLENAGIEHQVVAISEIDKYALKVYEKLYGDTLNLGDICKIDKLPKADLWTYSFPCTDISICGKMSGFEKGSNTRSSLLWEVERLLNIAKENNELPRYLLLENVKNIVSKKFKPFFDSWLKYLEGLGYKNFYKVLNSKNYGIPQNRERVFVLSILDENAQFQFPEEQELRIKLRDMLEKEVDERYFLSLMKLKSISNWKAHQDPLKGIEKEKEVSPTLTARGAGLEHSGMVLINEPLYIQENTKKGYAEANEGDGVYINRPHQKRGVVQKGMIQTIKTSLDIGVVVKTEEYAGMFQYIKSDKFMDGKDRFKPNKELADTIQTKPKEGVVDCKLGIRRLTPRECWRLMGWIDEDIDKALSAEVSETQLYKMAGNSIVVNVLTEIFKKLKESECNETIFN